MRHILVGTLVLALARPPISAQKIDSETPSRERVVRVQTAMNHLTVIEVTEPVTTVAVGSPQAFKVERRENKVFIQPLQENVATNLFIWTATTRLNYELVPAVADAGQMDFAIDYPQPHPQAKETDTKAPAPESAPKVGVIPDEMLLKATPVRLVGGERINPSVLIRDVYRKQDQIFVRYSIENRSDRPLRTGTPTVVSLNGLRFDRSLWAFQNSQLGPELAARLKTQGTAVPIRITRCEPGTVEIAPGEAQVGLMTLELLAVTSDAKKTQPTVLQFRFPVDRAASLTATLVL